MISAGLIPHPQGAASDMGLGVPGLLDAELNRLAEELRHIPRPRRCRSWAFPEPMAMARFSGVTTPTKKAWPVRPP